MAAEKTASPAVDLQRVMTCVDQPSNREAPDLERDDHLRLFGHMVLCRALDEKMLNLQRSGRIGFFGPGAGQEAAGIGSAFATEDTDWIFPALREGPALLLREFPLERYVAQLIGNSLDIEKGRQMPMHFSSKEHRYVSLSSCIGTQIPQAVGAAWAAKIRGEKTCVVGYLGDGATSEPDFHVAMNFAAVAKVPCVLFCQNNQWAISVPFSRQTASRGVAIKATAYGMEGVSVDGNDILAVYAATRDALEKARSGGGPTLIEAVTYRRGGHSSSDDPTRYRNEDDVPAWLLEDPIDRYRAWLQEHIDLTEIEESTLWKHAKAKVDQAIKTAEAAAPIDHASMFDDVYARPTPELERQRTICLSGGTDGEVDGEFPL